jgi:hypothetical protein
MGEPAAKKAKSLDLGSREYFMDVYDELKHVIVEEIMPKYGLPAEAAAWTREMMDYNVPGACGSWWRCARGARSQHPRPASPRRQR